MAIVAGTFTAADLTQVKAAMGSMFRDNYTQDLQNQATPIFDSLAQGQQLSLQGEAQILVDGRYCKGVKAVFLGLADQTVTDDDWDGDSGDCTFTGSELGADSKVYTPNLGFHKNFKVVDTQCRDMTDKVQKTAIALSSTLAAMDQALEKKMIAYIDSNADTATAAHAAVFDNGQLQDSGALIDVDGTDFTNKIIAKLKRLSDLKRMINPKIISGGNLYDEQFLAVYKDGDTTDYSTLLRPGSAPIPLINNLLELDAITEFDSTFLVDNGNIGYFNTYMHENMVPTSVGDENNTRVYRIPSNRLRWNNNGSLVPVYYDVRMKRICTGRNEWADVYEVHHDGAFILGPDPIGATRNGIVHIVKDWVDPSA